MWERTGRATRLSNRGKARVSDKRGASTAFLKMHDASFSIQMQNFRCSRSRADMARHLRHQHLRANTLTQVKAFPCRFIEFEPRIRRVNNFFSFSWSRGTGMECVISSIPLRNW